MRRSFPPGVWYTPRVVPEDVRRYAEDPAAYGPDAPPESGLERVLNERYCVLFGPVPSFTTVCRLRLDPEEVPETLTEVRRLVAERGHREAMWWVGDSATPADLVDRLVAHGLVPDERPGSEPHATSMALVEPPPAGPPEVTIRRVASLEEYRLANSISSTAFGASESERAEWDAIAEQRFAAERAEHAPRTYLAFVDGEAVGVARALFAPVAAVLLLSGGVVEHARGRGVYRALVRSRWDDAVAAGTPALTVHAGAMSRPILERLGFQVVSETEILLDVQTG
jgi:GNAT superfamily N-acetyltransferase